MKNRKNKRKNSATKSDTVSESSLCSLDIPIEHFYSIGFQSPSLTPLAIKIIYPNIDLRLSTSISTENKHARFDSYLKDEKELEMNRTLMQKDDPEYEQWSNEWRKLRQETKSVFEKCRTQTWYNFMKFYRDSKPGL